MRSICFKFYDFDKIFKQMKVRKSGYVKKMQFLLFKETIF